MLVRVASQKRNLRLRADREISVMVGKMSRIGAVEFASRDRKKHDSFTKNGLQSCLEILDIGYNR